jgi:hypothetical protein
MKLTFSKLLSSTAALSALMAAPSKGQVRVMIMLLSREVNQHLDTFNIVRRETFEKYGCVADKVSKKWTHEDPLKFAQALEEIASAEQAEVELVTPKVKYADLSEVEFPAAVLHELDWWIEL